MSRKGAIEMDQKRRRMHEKVKDQRASYKKQIYNKDISIAERMRLQLEFQRKFHPNTSQTRQRNRCSITGRPRGYFRFVGLSRITLRDLSRKGMLPGMKQASW